MIKRTIYFGNPVYLSNKLNQMVLAFPVSNANPTKQIPIEDIGILILDNPQITITHALINAIISNNAAVLWCDNKHLPNGLMLPLDQNNTFSEKLRYQLNASEPLKKQLWRHTVMCKIQNQSAVLKALGYEYQKLEAMAKEVQSGDPDNLEGQAAAIYWNALLLPYAVNRGKDLGGPNLFLNYGYAILRAITARSLVASGCLPAVGIFHKNKYNSFCLADDVMEPYRPLVDLLVFEHLATVDVVPELLAVSDKQVLLKIPVLDTVVEGKLGPLMVNMQRSTASLMQCFEGTTRKIAFPKMGV